MAEQKNGPEAISAKSAVHKKLLVNLIRGMDFRPVIFREAHEGEHVGLCYVHEGGEFRHLRTQLIGDLAPLLAGGLGVVLQDEIVVDDIVFRFFRLHPHVGG